MKKQSSLRALRLPAAALMLPILLAQCGGREELSVNVAGTFDVDRDRGRSDILRLESRLDEPRVSPEAFDAVWDAVTRTGTGDGSHGVALTMGGGSDPDAAGVSVLAGMVIVLPLPLTRNASWPVTRTIPPPSLTDMPMYWNSWGGRALARSGEAELALRVFDYHTIGMHTENNFVATGVTGTVLVLQRMRDRVELRLDITATDATGAQLVLRGDFSATAERYTPPIT